LTADDRKALALGVLVVAMLILLAALVFLSVEQFALDSRGIVR
jgi:hypothetical protein